MEKNFDFSGHEVPEEIVDAFVDSIIVHKDYFENTKHLVELAQNVESVLKLQEKAVRNTTDSYQEINESVDGLMLHLVEVTENVDTIEGARTSTLGAIESISAVLEEIVASINIVNQTSTDQVKSIETLNHSAINLNDNSEHLVQMIQRFTV